MQAEKEDLHSHFNPLLLRIASNNGDWMWLVRSIPLNNGGLDVVGTATNYFSEWTEPIPLKVINDTEVIQFLQWNIVTRFGVPNYLVFDNAKYFSSLKIIEFSLKYNINIKY